MGFPYPVFHSPVMRKGGFSFPYDFDASAQPDGALPAAIWEGSTTFAISSGAIINTPSTGSNLLTDPGLEATYTAGKCNTLSVTGSPTVAEITASVHEGSKAQEFTAAAQNNALYQSAGSRAPGWWRYHRWAKRTAGTSGNAQIRISPSGGTVLPATSGSNQNDFIDDADWTMKRASCLVVANSTLLAYLVDGGASGFDTVQIDDGSLHSLTAADLIAIVKTDASRLATAKIVPNLTHVDACWQGVVHWYADANNYLMALCQTNDINANILVTLIKVASGTASSLIAPTSVAGSAGAWLEIRPVDNDTVALYYNNAQVSTNKDVADVAGSKAGIIMTGGNSLNRFFVG